jgi:hypothetical protein
MPSYRRNAVAVGLLFIACSAASILSAVPTAGLLDAPDYLTSLAAHSDQVVVGALIEFVWAITAAGIAIALYPVIRKQNRALALGSVAARIVEGGLVLVGALCLVTLLSVSQEAVAGGSANASSFQAVGTSLLAARDWTFGFVMTLPFLAGALMYYYLLFKTRLVPRWLSGWGLVAALLALAATVYSGFTQDFGFSNVNIVLNIPIGVQEMVLAVWLIVKGFNTTAAPRDPAVTLGPDAASASAIK